MVHGLIKKEITLKKTPEKALRTVVIDYLERKIDECKEKIKKFEKKYGMNLEDFYDKLGQEFSLSWKHERDYMDWDFALSELKDLEEQRELPLPKGRGFLRVYYPEHQRDRKVDLFFADWIPAIYTLLRRVYFGQSTKAFCDRVNY